MKILIIRTMANEMNISSYNCQELGLAKGFIDQGHDCDIVMYTKANDHNQCINYKNKIITIFWRNALIKNKINAIYTDIDELLKKYDYIQLNEYDMLFSEKIYFKNKYKTYIYHGPYYDNSFSLLHKISYLFNKLKINIHKKNKNQPVFFKSTLAEKNAPCVFKNKKTVGVGLDFSTFENTHINFNKDNNYSLLYVGKLEPRRNILFLLDVLDRLREINNKYHLTMIGTGEKEYLNIINNKISKLNLQTNITIIDKVKQSEISNYYNKANLFLLASNYEIFGMVLLEALYFGVPAISTLNGGSSTLLMNNHNGHIVDLNVELWVDSINSFFTDEIQHTNYLEIHDFIVNNFSWDNIAAAILNNIGGN